MSSLRTALVGALALVLTFFCVVLTLFFVIQAFFVLFSDDTVCAVFGRNRRWSYRAQS
jgi:hypothetical protein